jgi:hypothetical protein
MIIAVLKELQEFAAFLAYQSCHRDGGSITKAMIEASIGLKYFGNPNDADSIGLAEQLVSVILHRCKKAATHLELILASEHNRHCS